MGEQRVFVWDLSTRLFHWLLAAAVTGRLESLDGHRGAIGGFDGAALGWC